MITFNEFIDKYLGKRLDYDGFYGGQCVDLFRYYVDEVLGFPQPPGVGGAAELWHSAQPQYYDFINNELTATPQYGDVVIWNRRVGHGFGHVSIFIEGNNQAFKSFDQNWPTLDECTITKHNYTNVIGWLRPKIMPEIPEPHKTNANNWAALMKKLGVDSLDVDTVIKSITLSNDTITDGNNWTRVRQLFGVESPEQLQTYIETAIIEGRNSLDSYPYQELVADLWRRVKG